MSAARVVLASLWVLAAGCAPPGRNLVADSEMRDLDQFWTIAGRAHVYPGLGPQGSALVYIPGNGEATGYRSSASFFALLEPGKTYTLSAYLDATGFLGTPPFVTLGPVNGTWGGISIYQTTKGTVSKTFTIPADSGTTLVRGTFDAENGLYPTGRGAEFSQPQIEEGATAHPYVPGAGGLLGQPPPGGNLVADSDLRVDKGSWDLSGRMRLVPDGARDGAREVEYDGDGKPSGFDDQAAFLAPVSPGTTYTFSMFMDGSAHIGTPPYVFLQAVDGSWAGASAYQPERGRVFVTFTLPPTSETTMIRVMTSPQNGIYPRGARFVAKEPQLAASSLPQAYVPGGEDALPRPDGGNAVIDSRMRSPASWRVAGTMRVENGSAVYDGTGGPSGYGNFAAFYARVDPGSTYTFSAFIDAAAHSGTPSYVFLSAVDGSWHGARVYQRGSGRIFTSFTIPAGARTTCIQGVVTPQNGTYPVGSRMTFAQPEIALGAAPSRYVGSSAGSAVPPHAASPCG